MKEQVWHVCMCFLIVILIVLASWQVQRQQVGWVIFDIGLASILLALRIKNA